MTIVLNPAQLEAVETTEGPVLILAGAGAGKTKTLTERIVEIIKKGTSPHAILAITFTNKAAAEMKERVFSRLKEEGILRSEYQNTFDTPVIKTFHSFGVFVLRKYGNKVGLTRSFIIKDSGDSLSLIKEAMKEEGVDIKEKDPGLFKSIISKNKNDFLDAQTFIETNATHTSTLIGRVWRRYEEKLQKENSVDFDDLLVKTVRLLRDHEDVREYYQNYFSYIHVDEYQDTNQVQYELCKILAEKHHNICVVGDGDQTIYSWRGANIKNILQFEKEYPKAKVILLEENYRSTEIILEAANTIISKNTVRKEKNLFTKQVGGERITLLHSYDEVVEGLSVAQECLHLEKNTPLHEIAVLYRANFQSRVLEEAFLRLGVPYQVLGTKFFDRKEVKDVISYLRVALNPESLTDIKRAIENPRRGIGKVTLLKLFTEGLDALPKSAAQKIQEFYTLLEKVKHTLTEKPLHEVLHMIIVESGMEKSLMAGSDEDLTRLENIRELVTLATKYEHIPGEEAALSFLEESTLISDQDNKDEKAGVKLMTVHASKGLEFDYVFIVGLEHDLFPHAKIGNNKQTKEEEEEERRLFYVALTRARKKLYLSYVDVRTMYGMRTLQIPSLFISDIPDHLLELRDRKQKNDFTDDETIVYI